MNQYIMNGVQWFDQNRQVVNAHGAGMIQENGRYYLFGEYKRDDKNSYNGFSCYSTENFATWHFEGMALEENAGERLNGERIGERVKVVRSRTTNKYTMLMHTDSLRYDDPCICYAVSEQVQGPYEFVGPLLYQGDLIRRWDMGTFVDEDGTAYLLTHEGYIYRLNDACTQAEELVVSEAAPGGESPAMCKVDGTYYWMFSNKTSWERNDNYYLTADSLYGPWTYRGLFCEEGSLTYNTQCSFILKYEEQGTERYMYIGDRWSFPRQAAAATLVFLPLEFHSGEIRIDHYLELWQPDQSELQIGFQSDTSEPKIASQTSLSEPQIAYQPFIFDSDQKGAQVQIAYHGKRILLFGNSMKAGGYARAEILDAAGNVIHEDIIDFYSAIDMSGLRYASPTFTEGTYTLRLTVLGEAGEWFKKDGTRFGSTGCRVCVTAAGQICGER